MTVTLASLKLIVANFSHSLGMLSEAIHSFLDLGAALITYFSVQQAYKPADENHPFGHGKIETLSGLFEAILLSIAGSIIFYESVLHLRNPQPLQHENAALITLTISLILSFCTYRYSHSIAQKTDSVAIHINSLHFLSDSLTSLGVLVGLALLKWTGWLVIDALIALIVSISILFIALQQIKKTLLELVDTQLPRSEIQTIQSIFKCFKDKIIQIHDLRTRKSGIIRHIDFHLMICKNMTVKKSHDICDEVENKIVEQYPNASVHIHVEPCDQHKESCEANCTLIGKC